MDELSFAAQSVDSKRILYTPSAFAKSNLLHLQEAGELQARKPHTNQRSGLASYLCLIVLSGSGTLTYGQELYRLSVGDCVFIDCRQSYAHATGYERSDAAQLLWALRWAHFNGPSMAGIYQKYIERGGRPSFHPLHPERFRALLEQIHLSAEANDYVRDMRINEKLSQLLTMLMEASWTPHKRRSVAPEKHVLIDVKAYIESNFANRITLDDLAGRFFINKFYLSRIFRERYSVSIINFVMILRVSEAKRLLRFSNLTIDKIGDACGMPNSNYFSRVFHMLEGMSPSEYRKQW